MPTPDTETLAARLRAVERALTDETTTLDPPSAERADARPTSDGGGSSDTIRTDGSGDEIEQRLCRLEAAVQALRAALGETGGEATRGSEGPRGPVEPPEPVTASDATRRTTPRSASPSGRRDADWPDDLADET
jgi:hypothetical protein